MARSRAKTIPTAATLPSLLAKASGEGKNLALHAGIEDPDVMPDLVGKADTQVRALAGRIDDEEALPEGLQDVTAPAEQAEPTDDRDTDEPEDDGEADETEEAADGSDDDDGGDAGDALGEMF